MLVVVWCALTALITRLLLGTNSSNQLEFVIPAISAWRKVSCYVLGSAFTIFSAAFSNDEDLAPKFKKSNISGATVAATPCHLQVPADSEGYKMCGYLSQKMKNGKWEKNWYVLREDQLYTYRARGDTMAASALSILGWEAVEKAATELNHHIFHLSNSSNEDEECFAAVDQNERDKWVITLKIATKNTSKISDGS